MLTRTSSPEQFHKMGRDLFNQGMYEDAAFFFERADMPAEAQRAKVMLHVCQPWYMLLQFGCGCHTDVDLRTVSVLLF